jgi:hypothetical protein
MLDDARLTRIVFVDNSGFPLEALKDVARRQNPFNKQCEFISLNDNSWPTGLQHGYAELGIVDAALETSQLLKDSHYFLKANGRLTFPGVCRLLDRLPDEIQFAVETRDFKIGKHQRNFVTTQLALFTTQFYRAEMIGIRERMSPEQLDSIEKLLYWKLMPRRGDPHCILRFPTNCDPRGMAAHGYKSYDTFSQSIFRFVRSVARVVAPAVWL